MSFKSNDANDVKIPDFVSEGATCSFREEIQT